MSDIYIIRRRLRAALRPRAFVELTETEQVDELAYAHNLCFLCLVPLTERGVLWTICPSFTAEGALTGVRRYLLHTGCAERVIVRHPNHTRATLRELIAAARVMRESR